MKRKQVLGGILTMIMGLSIVGCRQDKSQATESKSLNTPLQYVHTTTLTSESYHDERNYSGYVTAKEMKKYAFEIAGRVSQVNVEKGQYITKGQVLAQLDTTTLQLGVQNSSEEVNLAKNKMSQAQKSLEAEKIAVEKIKNTYDSNIEQLQKKYDLQKQICEGNEAIYEEGGMSKLEVDNAETSLQLLEEQIEAMKIEKENNIQIEEAKMAQLNEQIEAAEITLNQVQVNASKSQEAMNQSVLKSNIEGYVLEVPVKAGEVAAAGTPIVVIKTTDEIINMGIPAEAYSTIKEGMNVQIQGEQATCSGVITKIALYPDEATRTYNVEITPEKQDFVLGSLVSIKLQGEQHEGCFIPLSSVINMDGVNYVYNVSKTEKDGEYIIERVEVVLGMVKDEYVLATNLTAGTIIVDQGVRDVKENERVNM